MDPALLDTDILNEVLKSRNDRVLLRSVAYIREHHRFSISSMTRYEILRGLKEKNAQIQLARFDEFCKNSLIEPISDSVLDRSSDLWVKARALGREGRDADLIIAATAIELDRVLVTGNAKDFDWIPGLRIEDWRYG